MCSKSRAIQILAEAYLLCGQIFGDKIRDAYLCGSYARGDFDDENDVDILIDIRTGSDYDDFFAIAKDDVEKQVADAGEFIETVKVYLDKRQTGDQ